MKTIIALVAGCTLTATTSAQLTTSATIPTDDLQITYPGNATNNGTSMQTRVTIASTDYRRIAIKFDIDGMGIPANAVIASASLVLTPVGAENTTSMVLKRITTTTWTEASATLAPLTTTTSQVFTSGALVGGKRLFDVTNLVKDIFSGAVVNNGWLINCNPESAVTAGNIYHSLSSGTITAQPKLNISWYIPYSITGGTINHASTMTATDGSITPTIVNGSGSTTYEWKKNGTGAVIGTSSSISGLDYGWYGLKVQGAYDVFYMAFLVGVDCEIVPIAFAPGPEYVDDAYISWSTTANSGGNVRCAANRSNVSTIWGSNNSLMRFRLWMDPNLKPVQSKLTLFGNGGHIYSNGPNTTLGVLVTQDWQEYTVNSLLQPTVSTSIQFTLPVTTSIAQDQFVDMNPHWNYWKADNTLNYGIRVQPEFAVNYSTEQRFYSADEVTFPGKRPKIDFIIDDATCDRTVHTLFKRELDAGYATIFNEKLKFYFVEEYQIDPGKKIPLTLYDENNEIIAGIDINGSALPGKPLLTAFQYTFDDNRQELDLSTLSLTAGKYYILQLTRSTGEKEYIKFIYTN